MKAARCITTSPAVTAPAASTCVPLPAGTGIIAGGPMRAVFETLGIQDVVAKSIGSSNPYNMVRATFDALKHQDSPRSVAARRNIKVSTLQSRRVGGDAEVVAE
ncbi:ribosomal protein S5 [Bradyrhizobium elkanii]